jgi:aerotolerance protein batA
LARNNGIKVYTIGIGTDGYAESPAVDGFGDVYFIPQKVEIDEHLLNSIAENTGGKYFRADSSESLEYIYKEINQLEKTKIKGKKNYEYTEFFRVFLWMALVLLILDWILRWQVFKILK